LARRAERGLALFPCSSRWTEPARTLVELEFSRLPRSVFSWSNCFCKSSSFCCAACLASKLGRRRLLVCGDLLPDLFVVSAGNQQNGTINRALRMPDHARDVRRMFNRSARMRAPAQIPKCLPGYSFQPEAQGSSSAWPGNVALRGALAYATTADTARASPGRPARSNGRR